MQISTNVHSRLWKVVNAVPCDKTLICGFVFNFRLNTSVAVVEMKSVGMWKSFLFVCGKNACWQPVACPQTNFGVGTKYIICV